MSVPLRALPRHRAAAHRRSPRSLGEMSSLSAAGPKGPALRGGNTMTPILEVQDLTVRFPVFGGIFLRRTGEVRAVDGVSFTLARGETLGLVGESGCGKTTVGRAIVNILRAMSYRVEITGRI